ncbi:MAG: Homoserine kinase [uncultured Chloroflexi bacterium]|uniref:Homoserine kinase n=1 Tax=uncultured Chloroflexota bacterium TaxID=166587 RepID=A0A6J4JTC8_9CHLR|nr:MAG: Homoserine kinase [uncultured Chloroflexota bacterium]
MPADSVRVRVPATTANLGPGFDALGLALDLHEDVILRRLPAGAPRPEIAVTGLNARRLHADENLLAFQGVLALYKRLERAAPPLALELHTRIPRSGGLGGSAAAITGGIAAANALEGSPLDTRQLLSLATEVEGHPDNVSAALLGGLVVTVNGHAGLVFKRLDPPRGLSAVVHVPRHSISTKAARGVLPTHLSREDAVFNLSRTAMLVAAFQTADWTLLRDAMDDRLHQPARGGIYAALFPTIQAALAAGAHGAALSGSGAAIIAFATTRHQEIATAMAAAAEAHGAPGHAEVLRLSAAGVRVVEAT